MEDAGQLVGAQLQLSESTAQFQGQACERLGVTVSRLLDFWERYEKCGTEYHPEWDCRSIGEEGQIFLACLAGSAPLAPPERLQGVDCRVGGLATAELVLISVDDLAVILAEGGGILCLSREP